MELWLSYFLPSPPMQSYLYLLKHWCPVYFQNRVITTNNQQSLNERVNHLILILTQQKKTHT